MPHDTVKKHLAAAIEHLDEEFGPRAVLEKPELLAVFVEATAKESLAAAIAGARLAKDTSAHQAATEWGMTNIASLLKSEIIRLARKEVRAEVQTLKKSMAGHRSEIGALKKEVRSLQYQLKRASKGVKPPASEQTGDETRVRFSAAGMKAHRKKLKLSAKDYGLLIGASMLSVYKWEDGKVKPRSSAMARIAGVRTIGKREADRRLAELKGA